MQFWIISSQRYADQAPPFLSKLAKKIAFVSDYFMKKEMCLNIFQKIFRRNFFKDFLFFNNLKRMQKKCLSKPEQKVILFC